MIQGDQVWCDSCPEQTDIPEKHKGDVYHWLAKEGWTIDVDETFCPECREDIKLVKDRQDEKLIPFD